MDNTFKNYFLKANVLLVAVIGKFILFIRRFIIFWEYFSPFLYLRGSTNISVTRHITKVL